MHFGVSGGITISTGLVPGIVRPLLSGGGATMQYSHRQLAEKAKLTEFDLLEVYRCRREHNRLGFAYQLGFAKLTGRLPKMEPLEIVDELVLFTSAQLGIEAGELEGYARRQPTLSQHRERVCEHLGLERLGPAQLAQLESYVFEQAAVLDARRALEGRARAYLLEQRVLLPADSTLTRIVGEQRERARQRIFERVVVGLPPRFQTRLDALLEVDISTKKPPLARLKATPGATSVDAMLALMEKLRLVEETGILEVDLSWLSRNYQRALFHYASNSPTDRLKELGDARRYATLVCFLWQSYCDTVDHAIDLFDKLLTRTETKAQQELDARMIKKRKAIRQSLATLEQVADVLLDESVPDDQVRNVLFGVLNPEDLRAYASEAAEWTSGKNAHRFHGVMRRYGALRKFTPALLRAIRFIQEGQGTGGCGDALDVLRLANSTGRRKLPRDVPVEFVPRSLRGIVASGGKVDRRAWECALMLRLRDDIRSGNLSVQHSKRFCNLDTFLMDETAWARRRKAFFKRAGLPSNPARVEEHLRTRLAAAFDGFLASAESNGYARVENGGWQLSRDPAEAPESTADPALREFKRLLSSNMRRINLPDLLIEVNNDISFARHFMPPTKADAHSAEDVCLVLAAVMAQGCNLGSYYMSQLTRGFSYRQLKRTAEWHLTEDAQRGALAAIANAITALEASQHWGQGKTSASDGQRFSMRSKVLQRTYSPKLRDFALEFYSFIADNYAPFYSMPIECADRDSGFVLDGLLYNESELELQEHYTDTHGYTEVNFAAFAMLGRRFSPRIRGVHRQRIYKIDPHRDYGELTPLVSPSDRTIDTQLIASQWGRMGQLYASMEAGHSTASVVLKRLVSTGADNDLYRANRELGRVLKTEFVLRYMSEPALRRRVRRGLNKIEQLHALSRDVFYARHGRIAARDFAQQLNSCSCLTIVVACIIYWQAREMSRIVKETVREGRPVDVSLLARVSPIEWDNVVLYGQYGFNRQRVDAPG